MYQSRGAFGHEVRTGISDRYMTKRIHIFEIDYRPILSIRNPCCKVIPVLTSSGTPATSGKSLARQTAPVHTQNTRERERNRQREREKERNRERKRKGKRDRGTTFT